MEQTALGLAFLFSNPPFEASRILKSDLTIGIWFRSHLSGCLEL